MYFHALFNQSINWTQLTCNFIRKVQERDCDVTQDCQDRLCLNTLHWSCCNATAQPTNMRVIFLPCRSMQKYKRSMQRTKRSQRLSSAISHLGGMYVAYRQAFLDFAFAFIRHWSKINFSRADNFRSFYSNLPSLFVSSTAFASFIWHLWSCCLALRSCEHTFWNWEIEQTLCSVWQALSTLISVPRTGSAKRPMSTVWTREFGTYVWRQRICWCTEGTRNTPLQRSCGFVAYRQLLLLQCRKCLCPGCRWRCQGKNHNVAF